MLQQSTVEVLDKLNHVFPNGFENPMTHLWTLEGQEVLSFMNIHKNCQVLVASPRPRFTGLEHLEEFQSEVRPGLDTRKVMPRPHTWIQTAAHSWLRSNEVEDLPNYMDMPSQYSTVPVSGLQRQADLLDTLREEH